MGDIPRVLSVGQCGADAHRLERFVHAHAQADLDHAATAAQALAMTAGQRYDLILVNRVFDADGASGVAFITEAHTLVKTPLMLVSDYPAAQAMAVAAGALPGFGKSELPEASAALRLRQALRLDPPATASP